MKEYNDILKIPPSRKTLVARNIKNISLEQRERVLKATEYNMFSFPADLLTLDFLSDSGSGAMTDLQWSALFHGDESYGRNKGYYVLLDSIRDTFEGGNEPRKIFNLVLSGERDMETLIDELYTTIHEGGFVNGGLPQLIRPNAFIVPQGRCAEFLLFSTLNRILKKQNPNREYYIPSNGHFDTTEANIRASGINPINLFSSDILAEFPYEEVMARNPFKGDMPIEALKEFIREKGSESIPLIYLTITNNTAAGQPVSLKNIKEVHNIAEINNIPLFFDACRFAENAYFIKQYEKGYGEKSIPVIVKEMFSYVDGFTISFKKDGLANIGGGLFFKDEGLFHQKFSIYGDIGILLKEKQILTFGNDSYGGLSGRDIMAIAVGLFEVVNENYLRDRIQQVQNFALLLAKRNIPVVLPPGGHAVYLNMDKFYEGLDMKIEDFGGVGFTIELLKRYGIRACELGPFAFEWDKKTPEQRKDILNLVRFAIPRNMYDLSHIKYAVAAVNRLYNDRAAIPKVEISRGANLRLRHFQSGLQLKKLNIS